MALLALEKLGEFCGQLFALDWNLGGEMVPTNDMGGTPAIKCFWEKVALLPGVIHRRVVETLAPIGVSLMTEEGTVGGR